MKSGPWISEIENKVNIYLNDLLETNDIDYVDRYLLWGKGELEDINSLCLGREFHDDTYIKVNEYLNQLMVSNNIDYIKHYMSWKVGKDITVALRRDLEEVVTNLVSVNNNTKENDNEN